MQTSTNTYASDDDNLTLEKLMAALPPRKQEVLYRTSDFLPVADKEGKPVCYAIPELDALGDFTGRQILLFHPDNLAQVQRTYGDDFHLVEWQPQLLAV